MTSPDFTQPNPFNRIATPTKPTIEKITSRPSYAPGELDGLEQNKEPKDPRKKAILAAAAGAAVVAAIFGGPKIIEALSPAPETPDNNSQETGPGTIAVESANPSPSAIPEALITPTPEIVEVPVLTINSSRLANLPYLSMDGLSQAEIQAERDAATKELLTNNANSLQIDFTIGPNNTPQQILEANNVFVTLQNNIISSGEKANNTDSILEGITYCQFMENDNNTNDITLQAENVTSNYLSGTVIEPNFEAHFSANDEGTKWIQYTKTTDTESSTLWGNYVWSENAGTWQNLETVGYAPMDLGSLTEKWGTEVLPEN